MYITEDLQQIVDVYNLRIVPAPVFDMPTDLDYSALTNAGVEESTARTLIMYIVEFLGLPLIIDVHTDHTTRVMWRNEVGRTYGPKALSFIKNNKLRVNKFGHILEYWLFAPIDIYGRHNVIHPHIIKTVSSIRERYYGTVYGYHKMNLEEKLEAIRKLDLLFSEIFLLFRPPPARFTTEMTRLDQGKTTH